MADQWHYKLFGQEFGPVTFDELKNLSEIGTISGEDEVQQDGSEDWVLAASIRELNLGEVSATTSFATSESRSKTPSIDIPVVTDQWYYKSFDHVMGPVSVEELEEFARDHHLAPDDEVRLGENGVWRRAGSIGRFLALMPFQEQSKTVTRQSSAAIEIPVPAPAPVPTPEVAPAPQPVVTPAAIAAPQAPAPRPSAANMSTVPAPSPRPSAANMATVPAPVTAAPMPQAPAQRLSSPNMAVPPEPRPMMPPSSSSMGGYSSSSMSNMSSSSYSSMSSSSYSRPASPPPRPSMPVRRPSSGPSLMEKLTEALSGPQTRIALAAIVGIGLVVGFFYLPAGTGRDIARYRELKKILDDVRSKRADKSNNFAEVKSRAEKVSAEMTKELKAEANNDYPAKQCLLWAVRDELPKMMSGDLTVESNPEKTFASRLSEAARLLKVE